MRRVCSVAILVVSLIALLSATHGVQPPPPAPATVDFVRDVQPIFQQHCYECHGPDQQMNGFRLDRRHDAMRGGTGAVIGPGSAASSRLYLRLVGTTYGRRMPLDTEPLSAPEVETIRAWIDQGAQWPDSASGDVEPAPLDREAVVAFEAIRRGDRAGFLGALANNPRLSTLRGPGGATPLMAAALYGDTALVKTLLDQGANPNAVNDAGATPLMWALTDLDTTRLLVDRGADANARSNDGRVPLIIAAGIRGNRDVLALLMDHGAKPSAQSPGLVGGPMTAITEAAKQGDEAAIRLLIERGSDVARAGFPALALAFRAECDGCVEAIAAKLPPALFTPAMALAAPPFGSALPTKWMLERGADPNARNPLGFPVLVLAAGSDALPVDAVMALLAKGADLAATGPGGETALTLARRHGRTPVVDALVRAGATDPLPPPPPLTYAPAPSARVAVERSLPLLQRADVLFLQKAGCVSCHNNTQTAHTVALARSRAVPVDAGIAAGQLAKIAKYVDEWRERNLLGQGIPGDSGPMGAELNALHAGGHVGDATTDALARFIRLQQTPDGSWRPFTHRAPLETSRIKLTVEAMQALQAYLPLKNRPSTDAALERAAAWLKQAQPVDVQDRAFHLIGLRMTNAGKPAVSAAATRLLADQRPDGGWAQIPTLDSDAYATGVALMALLETNARTPNDPAVQRGIQFLLRTQLADGSWHVARRTIPLQPYFDAGFPHGKDQFISASATNWATQALLLTLTSDRGRGSRGSHGSRLF